MQVNMLSFSSQFFDVHICLCHRDAWCHAAMQMVVNSVADHDCKCEMMILASNSNSRLSFSI